MAFSSNSGSMHVFLLLANRGQSSVKHFTVTRNGDEYHFGMATFKNVIEFIDHFNCQPLLAGESGKTSVPNVARFISDNRNTTVLRFYLWCLFGHVCFICVFFCLKGQDCLQQSCIEYRPLIFCYGNIGLELPSQ
jgi:hypothetical protein